MPSTEDEFKSKMLEMEEMWQFPCCWSAIDGCHIPIKCPPGGKVACKEFHNYKNFYSIVLMAFVDSHYRFIWASCGFPGNMHDAIIFQSTSIYQTIQEKNCIAEIGKKVNGISVPPLLIADSAFTFHSWLMKPYTNAAWRVLLRKCESSAEEVKIATLACIVLHNTGCIKKNVPMENCLYIGYSSKFWIFFATKGN